MSPISYRRSTSVFVLVSLWAPSAFCADVYKWVDEKGQTHYSQRNDAAAKAKAVQLKVSATQPSASGPSPVVARDPEQEWIRSPRVVPKSVEAKPVPPQATSESRGAAIETNASKCKLARDVLSGAVEHSNGAPTDTNDRQVAESDIRLFCGK